MGGRGSRPPCRDAASRPPSGGGRAIQADFPARRARGARAVLLRRRGRSRADRPDPPGEPPARRLRRGVFHAAGVSALRRRGDRISLPAAERRGPLVPPAAGRGTGRCPAGFRCRLAGHPDPQLSWYAARRLAGRTRGAASGGPLPAAAGGRAGFCRPVSLEHRFGGGHLLRRAPCCTACLELIERDAASLWWRGGSAASRRSTRARSAPRPSCKSSAPKAFARRRSWLLDITTDIGVPTVAAVSCGPDGFGFAFGLASRADAGRLPRARRCLRCASSNSPMR